LHAAKDKVVGPRVAPAYFRINVLSDFRRCQVLERVSLTLFDVITGLDPAVHLHAKKMDPRVKPPIDG
jgi:hypothetical protein